MFPVLFLYAYLPLCTIFTFRADSMTGEIFYVKIISGINNTGADIRYDKNI